MSVFTESTAEQAALDWLKELGYSILYGPDIAPGELAEERKEYGDVVLEGRTREVLHRLNPHLPKEALDDVLRIVTRTESPNLLENNRRFHTFLTEGVSIQYQGEEGPRSDIAMLIDFDDPENNDWLAVNQFTVIEDEHNRRPDIVVFVNGFPLVVIEMKNPADEKATIRTAERQLQTYKAEIPGLFPFNEILIVSDGLEARHGTLTADWSRFMPWRTIDGKKPAPKGQPELETLIKGIFEKKRLLDIIRYFIVCEDTGETIVKKMGAYHQYFAVNGAVESTVRASAPDGDKRVGVVWHTQGSGKSLTCFAWIVIFCGRLPYRQSTGDI